MPSFGLAHSRPWRRSRLVCITASGAGAHKTTFTYENAGNRATKRAGTGAGNLTDYVYNAANQMIQVVDGSQPGPVEYAYDDDGNQVTVSVPDDPTTIATTYAWDYENRLIGALTGASQSTFTYDPDGRRVKSDNGAAVTRYVWDEENILREEDGSGTLQQLNTLEPLAYGNLISRRSASSSQYYHYDGLGSTNQVTDQAEAITYSYLYKAFGEPLVATGLAAPQIFRYVGQLGYAYDNATALGTPLYQIHERWYNPVIGRWNSFSSANPPTLSFGYARGLPFIIFTTPPRNERTKKCGFYFTDKPTDNGEVQSRCKGIINESGYGPPIGPIRPDNTAEIIAAVRDSKCCKLVFCGHSNGVDMTGYTEGGTPINIGNGFWELLGSILRKNCKSGCEVYLAGCRTGRELKNLVRYATLLGCKVCGAADRINEGHVVCSHTSEDPCNPKLSGEIKYKPKFRCVDANGNPIKDETELSDWDNPPDPSWFR